MEGGIERLRTEGGTAGRRDLPPKVQRSNPMFTLKLRSGPIVPTLTIHRRTLDGTQAEKVP